MPAGALIWAGAAIAALILAAVPATRFALLVGSALLFGSDGTVRLMWLASDTWKGAFIAAAVAFLLTAVLGYFSMWLTRSTRLIFDDIDYRFRRRWRT